MTSSVQTKTKPLNTASKQNRRITVQSQKFNIMYPKLKQIKVIFNDMTTATKKEKEK